LTPRLFLNSHGSLIVTAGKVTVTIAIVKVLDIRVKDAKNIVEMIVALGFLLQHPRHPQVHYQRRKL